MSVRIPETERSKIRSVFRSLGTDVTVNFGSTFTSYASTTVTGMPWVREDSTIIATAQGDVETSVLCLSWSVSDIVEGVGFTLNVFAPHEAKGEYTFYCVGA